LTDFSGGGGGGGGGDDDDVDDEEEEDKICNKIHKHFYFLSDKDYVFERKMPFFLCIWC